MQTMNIDTDSEKSTQIEVKIKDRGLRMNEQGNVGLPGTNEMQ